MTNLSRVLPTAALLSLITLPAFAVTIDFEEFGHGEIVTWSQGVAISTVNVGGGPDLGVVFDTNQMGTSDQDLQRISPGITGGETGWRGGNLAPHTDLGNILIIQEHSYSCNSVTCGDPDDEGSRPAGSIEFDFSDLGTFDEFSLDLIDIEESVSAEPGAIHFYLGATSVLDVMFSDFTAPEVIYGNNSANHLDVLGSQSVFGAGLADDIRFDRVVIDLGGSGGIDNITAAQAVPEPTAALLFLAGLGVVHARARQRNQ